MSVESILEEIETLVLESKHMPFTNQLIIDENEIINLMEDFRKAFPEEIGKAQEIVQDRNNIIEKAQEEAAKIRELANQEAARRIEQANAFAAKATDENEITLQAQEQARQILLAAQQQEKESMDRTIAGANQLKQDADAYANQVFDHVLSNIGNALNVVQQAKSQLNQPNL